MKYKKTTLSNGLRVITIPVKGNPSVTTMVVVETGSNYETKEQNGLSHFLEHMCFKGTTHRPTALDIALELDGMGAYNNAFTMHELTGYYAKAKREHFKKIFEIISDMYLNPIFPKEDLEKERGVIIEEIEMYEDQPQSKVWNIFNKLMYGDTPAGKTVIGPKENIKNFKHEDFDVYRKTHYVSGKTIVVVSGDVTHQRVLAEVKKNFKAIPQGKVVKKESIKESQKVPALLVEKKKSNQTHMIMAFRSYGAKNKRIPALTVISYILGGGMSGRLWQKLRHEMGACYYIEADHNDSTDHGFLCIATGINASRTEEVTKAIIEECKKLKEGLVPEDELLKAKENFVGHLFMGLETSNKLAEFYGIEEVTCGDLKTPHEIEKMIRQVTSREIMEVAKDVFKDEKLNLAIVGNVQNERLIKKVLTFK